MYLDGLSIHGFKSFARKTSFKFNDGTTAIVGPNGCGKSNIVDAIRWVLGEQKAGIIRSERMENVIFNGTKGIKPLGMAEVSLTIQNTKNVLPIEYSEVVITRRLFRSLESQYLLNNTTCRLKDIQNLFMDTGMGPDAYSIIELSMVETILNGKAEERRRIIEEAAGVTKYKMRRKSAFRKLEATEADLMRVNDIISEVEKNVNSLKRQVRKAQRYQEFSDQVKEKEIRLAVHQFSKVKSELEPLLQSLHETQDQRVSLGSQLDEKEAKLEEERRRLLELERDLSARQKHLNELSAKIQEKEEGILVARERIKALDDARARMNRDKDTTKFKLSRNAEEISHTKENLQALFEKIHLAENEYQDKNADLKKIEVRLQEQSDFLKGLENQRVQAIEGLTESKQEEQRIKTQLESIAERVEGLDKEIEENRLLETIRQDKLTELKRQQKNQQKEFDQVLKETEEIKEQLERIVTEKDRLKEKILQRRSEVQTLKERIELLKKFIESYEDHPEGVQHLLLHGHLNGGCKGTLGDNLVVNSTYRRAVETAMGDASVSLIVEATDQAMQCIDILKADDKGSVTFFPLDRFANGHSNGEHPFGDELLNFEGVIGWAFNLVECDDSYKPLVRSLLGEYLVVKDLSVARQHSESFREKHLNFVTLNGEVVSNWGPIRGGDTENGYAGIIGRKALIDELQSDLKSVFVQLDREEKEAEQLENRYQSFLARQSEAEKRKGVFEEQTKKLEVEIAQLEFESKKNRESNEKILTETEQQKSSKQELLRKFETVAPSLQSLAEDKSRFEGTLDEASSKLAVLKEEVEEQRAITQDSRVQLVDLKSEERHLQENAARLNETERELRETLVRTDEEIAASIVESEELQQTVEQNKSVIQEDFDQHKELQEQVHQLEQEYFDGKEVLDNQEKALRELRGKKETISDEMHGQELRASELKSRAENIRARIREEYHHEIKEEPLDSEFDDAAAAEEIEQLNNKLESMGPVNLLALKEYEKENSRLEFLLSQKNDLIEAEQNLAETIQLINKTARDKFNDIFSQIQENFTKVFHSFFEDGQARLTLESDTDPLEADVIIEADPKGRRISALSLLSGGEKTLTAISLLFAIYLVKPSPFCILDEVDAPLDDANIGRFNQAIRDFSSNTQFIIVTHNKLTMRASNSLYGVTMEEPGVSKIVSVNFTDMEVEVSGK